MSRPLNTKIVIFVIASLLLAVGLAMWWANDAESADASTKSNAPNAADRPVTVKTALSRREDLSVSRDIPATIAPLQQVIVRPQISGQIERLYFEEGQALRAGQLMATLDSRSLRADVASAEAELARVQSQLEVAQEQQRRYQSLVATQAVSQQEVAELLGQTKQLQAQLNATKANLDAQRVRLSLTQIVAPIDGRVGLRQVSVGAQVSSNDTNGIATLTQTQPISVQFGVPEQLLSQSTLMDKPIAVYAMSGEQLLANSRISRQDSQVDRDSGSLSVRAILANPDERFRSGQSVRVRLAEKKFNQVVTVPSRAIQQGLKQSFVYVIQADSAKMTPVKLLAQSGERSAVEGIDPNTEVVIEGHLRLKDGSKVKVEQSTEQPVPAEIVATGAGS